MSVAGLALTPMRFARRDPASPPRAKAMTRSRMVSRSVVRERTATLAGLAEPFGLGAWRVLAVISTLDSLLLLVLFLLADDHSAACVLLSQGTTQCPPRMSSRSLSPLASRHACSRCG